MKTNDWDAIVVGAGPGGASAAYHMAARGLRVALLDRSEFPRDKSCGDGVTRSGVGLLREMGVLDLLDGAQVIRGARVRLGEQGQRELPFPLERYPGTEALVVPRLVLDHAICRRAQSAGAELIENFTVHDPIVEDGVVVGVHGSRRDGTEQSLFARVVVAADGAASPLARKVGLREAHGTTLGSALRGYYDGISGLDDYYEFDLSLVDTTGRVVLPSYGWVFPTGPTTANIGVGLFERVPGESLRALMERFVDELTRRDPRFAKMRPTSGWLGAPLRFDFDPERSACPGLMLVGDAAGLVSPFTGEGISYALESGRIAADIAGRWFDRHEDGSPPPVTDYALALAQRFTGYFEAGREAGARYRLVWKTLHATFRSERPLHQLCRRLVLLPDAFNAPGKGELLEDISGLLPRAGLKLRDPMLRVAELLTSSVRREWPFLARLSHGRMSPTSLPLRPSLLLLLAAHFGPREQPLLAEAGAAIELGYLSFLAHTGVDDAGSSWGNSFSVLVGEYLLAKAYELMGQLGAAPVHALSEAVSRALSGLVRDRRLAAARDESDALRSLDLTTGTLGALPCRLGAELAGASLETQAALASYGRALAITHALISEAKKHEGSTDMLDGVVTSDVDSSIYDLATIRCLRAGGADAKTLLEALSKRPIERETMSRVVREAGAAQGLRDDARRHSNEAIAALASLPVGPARRALERLALYAADRRAPAPRSAHELLTEMTP